MSAFLDGFIHAGAGAAQEGLLGTIGIPLKTGTNLIAPFNRPAIDGFIDMYFKGYLTTAAFKEWSLREGWDFPNLSKQRILPYKFTKDNVLIRDPAAWPKSSHINNSWLQSQLFVPEIERIILWFRRGWVSFDVADNWLRSYGMTSPELRQTLLQEVNEYPTAQDLIQFSVRHGFEPDILKTFGYAKEIPSTYLKWAGKIGLGGSSEVEIADATDADGNPLPTHKATWAEQHWFAHWILPSLGDAYEMLHRLYPKSDFGPSPDWANNLDFTPELLSLFQRAQDIPSYWRNRLQAISYLPLSRVDVRRMFNLDVIDRSRVYHSYRAQGYSDENAKSLLKYAEVAKRDTQIKNEAFPKAEKICQFLNLGIISEDKAKSLAKVLHVPDNDMQDMIDNCTLERTKTDVTTILKGLHRAFVKGVLDENQAREQLQSLQLEDKAVNHYIFIWRIERTLEFREDSASEAAKWYEQGIITQEEFVARLQNLGILPSSVLRMVQSATVTILEKQAKELASQLKFAQTQIKIEQQKQKQEQQIERQQEKDRLKALLQSSTQTNLKTWYKDGLITSQEVAERLTLLNYSITDIERWLEAYKAKPPKPKKGK